MSTSLGAFGALLVTLYAAHQVGDHWVQTQGQADAKSGPGWAGRGACLAHVTTYSLTLLIAIWAVAWRTGLYPRPGHLAAGLLVSAISHYLIDRRWPLAAMCRWLGKDPGWLTGHGGYYAMDQSWHHGWLLISALLIV